MLLVPLAHTALTAQFAAGALTAQLLQAPSHPAAAMLALDPDALHRLMLRHRRFVMDSILASALQARADPPTITRLSVATIGDVSACADPPTSADILTTDLLAFTGAYPSYCSTQGFPSGSVLHDGPLAITVCPAFDQRRANWHSHTWFIVNVLGENPTAFAICAGAYLHRMHASD